MVSSIFILLCSFIWQNLYIYKANVYQLASVWKTIKVAYYACVLTPLFTT